MTEQLVDFTCQICGGELEEKGDGVFRCRYCGKRWEKESVEDSEKIFETLEDALREQRRADLAALARRRYEETHKEFVSNATLEGICNQILNLNPEDFYARFYLATCKEDGSLESFLSSMDIAKHYYDIEDMLKFLIRGLKAGWINAVSTLIENAYKSRDLEKYNLYRTKFEEMAENVENGIFEPILPRDIFIAYSSRDMKEVNALVRVLEEENGLSCFVAARNLRHGSGAVENYRGAIHTALHNCKAVVFVSSTSSRNVKCEATMELGYIKEHLPKMWRIEFLVENYKGIPVERIFTSFFDGLEYCTSAQEVAGRYFDKYMGSQIDVDAARHAEEERLAKQKAEEERIKEEEAHRIAEAERKAEEERLAKQKEEEEALRIAEAERKAEEERLAKLPASPLSDFEIENGVLTKYKGTAENVVIPNIVTSIGAFAFNKFETLQSVTIPDSVKSIGDYAFSYCSVLTSVYIPGSVKSIGQNAFASCSALESITISEGVTDIGEDAFYSCESLKRITIPSSIKSIGESAFFHCFALENITLSDGVASIENNAFHGCESLASIKIPASVTSIGNRAFAFCEGMKTIYCDAKREPKGWDDGWRGNCPAEVLWGGRKNADADTLLVPGFVIEKGVLLKYKGDEENVVIPDGITSIGKNAFSYCTSVKSISVPSSVTSIGIYAFTHCKALEGINIPEGVTDIGQFTFFSCSSLESLALPPRVKSIGNRAFGHCKSLENIVLSPVLASIGESAFHNCISLTSINLPSSVSFIGKHAFDDCKNLKTICYEVAETSYYNDWKRHWLGNCSAYIDYKRLIDFDIQNGMLIKYRGHSEHVVIPGSVTSIGAGAFSSLTFVQSVTMYESVTSIGKNAFSSCKKLKNINIPRSVTSIGAAAFQNCGTLESVIIPESIATMGDSAFSSCGAIKTIYCEAEQQPQGWHKSWLGKLFSKTSAEVVWGYKG